MCSELCNLQSKQTVSVFHVGALRIARLQFLFGLPSQPGGLATLPKHRAVPVFSNFPSLAREWPLCCSTCRHSQECVCAWQPDVFWQEVNSPAPCAVNTWLVWLRGGCKSVAPSLAFGALPTFEISFSRGHAAVGTEDEPLFAFHQRSCYLQPVLSRLMMLYYLTKRGIGGILEIKSFHRTSLRPEFTNICSDLYMYSSMRLQLLCECDDQQAGSCLRGLTHLHARLMHNATLSRPFQCELKRRRLSYTLQLDLSN